MPNILTLRGLNPAQIIHDAQLIKAVPIDDTDKADKKALQYDQPSNTIIYTDCFPGFVVDFIQHFLYTLPSAETSQQITINEVDLQATFIIYSGRMINNSYPTRNSLRIQLINSTHVELTRQQSGTAIDLNFALIKTASGIKSIQRGTITLTNQSETSITISQVDLNKTFVSHLGLQSNSTLMQASLARIFLSDLTTLTAQQALPNVISIISYEIVEFI